MTDETFKCRKCGEVLPKERFGIYTYTGVRKTSCKKCEANRCKEWREEQRNTETFGEWKARGGGVIFDETFEERQWAHHNDEKGTTSKGK